MRPCDSVAVLWRACRALEAAAELCSQLLAVLAENPNMWQRYGAEELGEVACLMAIDALQIGSAATADRLLRRLGCEWRLAAELLRADVQPGNSPSSSPPAERRHGAASMQPLFLVDALPPATFATLQQGFSADSAYWAAHGGPQHPFQSYLCSLVDRPSDALGDALRHLHCRLAASPFGAQMAGVTYAEWWAVRRYLDQPHQLHWDVNETHLRRGAARYKLRHPAVSSVLFLSEGGDGGPTLVLEQRPGGALASRGWGVPPRPNALLAFPGDLLHGVAPGMAMNRNVDVMDLPVWRTTFVIAWWSEHVAASLQPEGAAPGAMMRLPRRKAAGSAWLRGFALLAAQEANEREEAGHGGEGWFELAAVSPAWVPVRGAAAAHASAQALPRPDLRFFLVSRDDINDLYVLLPPDERHSEHDG